MFRHENHSSVKLDARSKRSNLASFNGLEILCPKAVRFCNFLHGLLHPITYLLANMESKRSLEGCQIATLANTGGGNMITKGFLDRFFHGAIYLRFLFQKTVHNEMHLILTEMHFMVVPYWLKTRGYYHTVSVQDETGIYLSHNFSKEGISCKNI